jgi:prepilin peptidase CpaA
VESLLGLSVCGFVMLVCFVMFKVGGGDVKLMAMLGAFLGPEQGITAMLWTFVLGACMGLIVLIWRVGPVRTMVLVFRRVASVFLPMWFRGLTDDERVQLQPPLFLAPSALAAVVIVRFSVI